LRAILFGAGGQLGVDLARECRKRGHSILALRRSQLDIADEEAVRRRISRHRPDWVINAAAYNKVDLAEKEPEAAMRVNAFAVRSVAMACAESGATLLHYSTDHVFGGDKGLPYTEDDLPAPQSVYGVSKLAGEMFARACCSSHYVLRVAGVFGPPGRYTNHGNFPEFVLRKCAEGHPLRIVDDEFATPTFGTALVARSLDILEKRMPCGLYHLSGGEVISWYDFARKIAAASRCPAEIARTNHAAYMTRARRPRYAALSNKKIEAAGIARMPGIDESVGLYLVLRKREHPQSWRTRLDA
jgi:dTDP-4-dehydrorhamnose reductase